MGTPKAGDEFSGFAEGGAADALDAYRYQDVRSNG